MDREKIKISLEYKDEQLLVSSYTNHQEEDIRLQGSETTTCTLISQKF